MILTIEFIGIVKYPINYRTHLFHHIRRHKFPIWSVEISIFGFVFRIAARVAIFVPQQAVLRGYFVDRVVTITAHRGPVFESLQKKTRRELLK